MRLLPALLAILGFAFALPAADAPAAAAPAAAAAHNLAGELMSASASAGTIKVKPTEKGAAAVVVTITEKTTLTYAEAGKKGAAITLKALASKAGSASVVVTLDAQNVASSVVATEEKKKKM